MNTRYKVNYGHYKGPGVPMDCRSREFASASAAGRFRNKYLNDAKTRSDKLAFAFAERQINGGHWEEI